MAYNVALDTIAKSSAPDAADLAEALLERMQLHFNNGDKDLSPTTQSFSTVMNALARSVDPEGGKKAEKLLQMMHELQADGTENVVPNTIAYTTCILAWSKSGQSIAGKRADSLLRKMEKYYDEGLDDNMKPNAISYTNAMEAWINSRQPNSLERVEAILDRMIERSRAGDTDSAPTTTSFNVALKAIRLSSEPMKHHKAENIFNRIKELHEIEGFHAKPSIQTYNEVSRHHMFKFAFIVLY